MCNEGSSKSCELYEYFLKYKTCWQFKNLLEGIYNDEFPDCIRNVCLVRYLSLGNILHQFVAEKSSYFPLFHHIAQIFSVSAN